LRRALLNMQIEHNPEFIRSIKSDELLPEVSKWTTLGGFILLTTCGAAILVSSIINYPVTVKATATVRPAGELRIVEATASGVVNNILVKENQPVEKAQTIAILDSSQQRTRKSQIVSNIRQNQLAITQIDAQIDALASQIQAEAIATSRSIASAQADLTRAQREYQDRQVISVAEVEEANANVELAREEMNRYGQLAGVGAISQLQIKEKEQAYKASMARLQRAKAGLNPTVAGMNIAQERISQEEARGQSTLAVLRKEEKSLRQQRIVLENEVSRDQKELQQILTEIQKSIIRTVEAGTITSMELRNSGQVVNPGQAIARILPKNAPLVIKARVAADDISKVSVCTEKKVIDCQNGKVQMRISAYPYPDYGVLRGAVRQITADTIVPQGTAPQAITQATPQNTPYYEVSIEPEKLYLMKGDRSYSIQVGMEVAADIISKEETLMKFILRRARLLTDI
jgi:multidrug efflux pump subunit AcrA (membrane-fusion protein)